MMNLLCTIVHGQCIVGIHQPCVSTYNIPHVSVCGPSLNCQAPTLTRITHHLPCLLLGSKMATIDKVNSEKRQMGKQQRNHGDGISLALHFSSMYVVCSSECFHHATATSSIPRSPPVDSALITGTKAYLGIRASFSSGLVWLSEYTIFIGLSFLLFFSGNGESVAWPAAVSGFAVLLSLAFRGAAAVTVVSSFFGGLMPASAILIN